MVERRNGGMVSRQLEFRGTVDRSERWNGGTVVEWWRIAQSVS